MRFRNKFLLVLVFIVMSFSVFSETAKKKEDVKVPNIVLYDQYGKKHNLEEYKGKVVFINFWATWCGYCVQELPAFEKLYKEFGENKKDVIFLGVAGPKTKDNSGNVDIKKEEIIKFLSKKKVTYPVLFDETGRSFQEYGIRFFPTSFVVNKKGYLEGYIGGAISEEQLRKALKETLKK